MAQTLLTPTNQTSEQTNKTRNDQLEERESGQ